MAAEVGRSTVIGVALALAGCSPAAAGPEAGVRVVPGAGGSVVVVAPPSVGAGEAIVGGTVALTAGGCVGLRVGEVVELAIWPSGTVPLEGEVGVDVPRIGSFAAGDVVRTGGGYGDPEHVRGVAAVPRECLTEVIAYPSGE